MPRAQTSGEISREEMSRNCVCPTCTGRRTARWRATVRSNSQTAPGDRAAHIWLGPWENRLFPRAIRVVRDDCRAAPSTVWCRILPGRQQNRRAARNAVWKSQAEITTAMGKWVIQCRAKRDGRAEDCRPYPLNEFGQAFPQLRCRIVSEQFSRLRNVGTCTRHIAGLFREAIDFCFFPYGIFDRRNQVLQLNRLILAEIKDVIQRTIVIERGHGALNDIVNVGVIATRASIPKLIDRCSGVNAPGELMNRQIRTLPRAVNSEIPQSDNAHLVEVRICRAKKFACYFRGAVGAKCLREMFLFGKWDRL